MNTREKRPLTSGAQGGRAVNLHMRFLLFLHGLIWKGLGLSLGSIGKELLERRFTDLSAITARSQRGGMIMIPCSTMHG